MSLSENIQNLRDRTLTELTAAHDYYADTQISWQIVHRSVSDGHRFIAHNPATGTRKSQDKLVTRSHEYVTVQLVEATFQQFITIFEAFFFDLLRHWLTAFPQSLGKRTLDFKTILDAPDKEALTFQIVGRELNDVLYGRPSDWFEYLDGKVRLGCPTTEEIARLSEAKATRDILVHNRGVVNSLYLSKAGPLARYPLGERVELSAAYHRGVWDLLRKLVADLSDAALLKAV
jgi:hypothetical protein